MLVYKGTNVINGKVYIGVTIRTLEIRLIEHKYKSKYEKYYFYRAIRKHGWDSFSWEVIDRAETEMELIEKEAFWINHFKSYSNKYGYNSTRGGEGTAGFKHTEESKRKMSISRKGHPGYMKGKRHSDESRLKISKSISGENNPMYGTKGNLSPNFGKKHTEASKMVMYAKSKKGTDNHNAKLTEDNVLEIKNQLKLSNLTVADIAKLYNVSRATIINIRKGKTWKHV